MKRDAANVLVGVLGGLFIGLVLLTWAMPSCPTEDSCKPDYQHHWYGRFWTGVEVTP